MFRKLYKQLHKRIRLLHNKGREPYLSLSKILGFYPDNLQIYEHQTVQVDLFKKVRTLELSKYDDPDFYNNFILAMQYADTYAAGTVGNFTSLIQYFLNFFRNACASCIY